MGDGIEITINPKPLQIDGSWGFKFTLADGRRDYVNGLLSERQASGWLAGDGVRAWAGNQGYVIRK
jgi:hypothetical protein